MRKYDPKQLRTPYEKLCSLPDAPTFLRSGMTMEQLEAQFRQLSDNESAQRRLRERKKLFEPILESPRSTA